MHDLTTSVIIPTYNGASKISTLMNALLRQTDRRFEVIVVIDGSTDNTEDTLRTFADLFENLVIVKQENKGRSASRNNGVNFSKGKILIFYDDDMEPENESVQKHISFHEKFMGLLCGNPIEDEHTTRSDI